MEGGGGEKPEGGRGRGVGGGRGGIAAVFFR